MPRVGAELKGTIKDFLLSYAKNIRVEVAREMTVVMHEIQDTARRLVPVDTSNLQSSIQSRPSAVDPDALEGRVETSLEYAKVQEFGFTDEVQVDAHKRTMEQGFGDESEYPKVVTVQAHTRRMDIEGSFYMTRAALQASQTYNKRIGKAVRRVKR